MTDEQLKEITYFIENYVYFKDKNTGEIKKVPLRDYQINFLKTL